MNNDYYALLGILGFIFIVLPLMTAGAMHLWKHWSDARDTERQIDIQRRLLEAERRQRGESC